MKILYRYIARKFWGPFLFILLIFSVLIFLGDSVEKMRWINSYGTSLHLVLKYSLLTMPSWLLQVLPIACLLSSLFVISDMIAAGEWTACIAGGYTVKQIFKPLILCIALVAAGGFLVQEFVTPDMSKKAELTLQRKIRGKKEWYFNVQNDVTLRLDDKRILFAKKVLADKGVMEGMFIDVYDQSWSISSQISAKRFVWNKRHKYWVFEDGFIRNFGSDVTIKETPFDRLASDFSIPPKQIAVGKANASYLNIADLIRRIKFLNASGLSSFAEQTYLNYKLAAPFATIIMCLLGMPLAIALKRSSKLLNIVSAITIGFTFWWIVSMLSSAGQTGMINPIVAGWLPVGFFTIVAFIEFKIVGI